MNACGDGDGFGDMGIDGLGLKEVSRGDGSVDTELLITYST